MTDFKRYRKPAVEIQAFEFTGSLDRSTYPKWIQREREKGIITYSELSDNSGVLLIWSKSIYPTHTMVVKGEFVVKDEYGKVFVCDRSVFEDTYEVIED